MRATMAGRVLGKAMESFDTDKAVTCPSQGMGNLPTPQCGSVMLFVNLADYFGQPVDVMMAEREATETDSADGLDTATGETVNTSDGLSTPADVRLAISVPTKAEKTLSFLETLRDERAAASAPASEILTDRISATGEIITPTLIADQIFAKSIKADSIEGLSIWTDQIASLSQKYSGLTATTSTAADGSVTTVAAQQLAIAMKDLSADSITVQMDGSILGKLTVAGALRVGGDAQFDGNTIFSKLATFLGDTLFSGKVFFEKAPTFGSDTAGFALIKKDERRVHVAFDAPYERQPIVAVSMTNDQSPLLDDEADDALKADVALVEKDYLDTVFGADLKYIVTEKSTNGFTIVLSKPAPYDIQFSWVAVAVKKANTSVSESTPQTDIVVDPTAPLPPATTVPVASTLVVPPTTATETSTTGTSAPSAPTTTPSSTIPPVDTTSSTVTSSTTDNTAPPATTTPAQ
jgi:hypothetical protein